MSGACGGEQGALTAFAPLTEVAEAHQPACPVRAHPPRWGACTRERPGLPSTRTCVRASSCKKKQETHRASADAGVTTGRAALAVLMRLGAALPPLGRVKDARMVSVCLFVSACVRC